MADIDIHRAHDLGLKSARAAAERMAAHLAKRFDLRGEWSGNVLSFQRPGVTGSLAVSDKDLRLTVTLGLLLKALRGSIESSIHEELDKLFASAKAPAAKPKKDPPRKKKGG
jgi:putative polyhydroxyalkanoate system protein